MEVTSPVPIPSESRAMPGIRPPQGADRQRSAPRASSDPLTKSAPGPASTLPLPFRKLGATVILLSCLLGPVLRLRAQGPEIAQRPLSTSMQSIRLVPTQVTLDKNGEQHFLVLARYSDRLERDITGHSRFSVSDPRIARVDAGGRVQGLAPGTAFLTVRSGRFTSRSELRVEDRPQPPFHFSWDIGRILTQQGCNGSPCHGSLKGRGGFKLSKNALQPEQDYAWIVEGGTYHVLSADTGEKKARVNLDEPKESLLLAKPTLRVPHGGGRRLEKESPSYRMLLNWVKDGAPYGEAKPQRRLERLEVFPQELVLTPQTRHQLLVTAHFPDGRREDVTHRVRYTSGDSDVVAVDGQGLAQALQAGETVIRIETAGRFALTIAGVISQPLTDYPTVSPYNFIDPHTFGKMRKFHLIPSGLSSDAEFLRRVCLDLTGTLPPANRVREFLRSSDPQKRSRLVDILLASPEFADHWTWRLGDVLRIRNPLYEQWLRDSLDANKPYDRLARERVAAQGYDGPSRHYEDMGGTAPPLPHNAMAEEVRVFLGRRLDCAQCHDHPYESWTQDQFWGLAAFFGRLSNLHPGKPQVDFVIMDDPAGYGSFGKGGQVLHPRTRQAVSPRYLDGSPLEADRQSDPRLALAEWITSPSNPYFSEVAVNRVWSYLLGRGIVDPVDDFGSAHPPTHPRLLKALARRFVEQGYDLRALIRLIIESRTYQLSGTPNVTNQLDRVNYSRYLPRPLDVEVLLNAISQVVGVRDDNGQFLRVYGKPDRTTFPDRNMKPNLAQALHQLAGPTFTTKFAHADGRIRQLLQRGAPAHEIVEDLYLSALSRFPSPEERTELERMLGEQGLRKETLEDLLWALINSEEFLHNH